MKYPKKESATLEFKREVPKNDQIIKTIIGFCNYQGGQLIVGVDNDGSIIGIPENTVERLLEHLETTIFQACQPTIVPLIYAQRIGDKTILIIEVSSGMNKPYYLKSEGPEKGTFIRLGRSTVHATPDMIDELRWQSRGRSYDQMAVYQAHISDLNLPEFKNFLSTRKAGAPEKINTRTTNEALNAYHIIVKEHTQEHPTVAGILLFGNEPQFFFSEAFIICSHFAGIAGRDTLATRDCDGTLVTQFKKALEFILSCLNKSFVIRGIQRIEELEIPEQAIREMLLNAIVHRNYHIAGPIKVAVYRNRIEIFSPGTFPRPIRSENLTAGFTHIRNATIVKIFRELGYIEKLGTGFRILFGSYEQAGLPKPQVIEGDNYIKCILPRPTPANQAYRTLPSASQKIVDLFDLQNELSIAQIIQQTHLSRATAGRLLAQLIKEGVLERIGQAKATRYIKKG